MILQPDLFGGETPVVYNITGVAALKWKHDHDYRKYYNKGDNKCGSCDFFYNGFKCQIMGDAGVRESWVHDEYGCDEYKKREVDGSCDNQQYAIHADNVREKSDTATFYNSENY